MATTHTITGSIADWVPGVDPRRVRAVAYLNIPATEVVVEDSGTVWTASKAVTIDTALGTFAAELLATDATDLNVEPDTLRWTIALSVVDQQTRIVGRTPQADRRTVTLGPFPVTADGSIGDLTEHFDTPAVSPQWRSAFRDEMEGIESAVAADRAYVENLVITDLGTTDGQTAALIESPSSQTAAALNNAIATAVDPLADEVASIPRAGNTFVALGDSISSPSGGGSAGSGWHTRTCMRTDQRLWELGNAGVPGNTSTQIAARVGDVVALGPRLVSVLAGTNDFHNGVTFATWRTNITNIVTTLVAAGIRPILCTIPPRRSTTHLSDTSQRNAWLQDYALAHGFPLLDFFTVLSDPATGAFAAGMSVDDLHPSPEGHKAMATHAVAVLDPLLLAAPAPVAAHDVVTPANMLTNGLFTADAIGWRNTGAATSGVTFSFEDDPYFLGRARQMECVNPDSTVTLAHWINDFVPGDTLRVTGRVKVVSASSAIPSGAGAHVRLVAGGNHVICGPIPNVEQGLFKADVVIPAGVTVADLQLHCNITSADSMTVRWGQITVRNLSQAII